MTATTTWTRTSPSIIPRSSLMFTQIRLTSITTGRVGVGSTQKVMPLKVTLALTLLRMVLKMGNRETTPGRLLLL